MKSRTGTPRMDGYWAKHIEGWRTSGLSQLGYCQKHGIPLSTFGFWRKRLAGENTTTALEIVPVNLPGATSSTPVVVVVAGGRYRVELQSGFSQAVLCQVVDALEDR
jgi:hypothetical protein